MINKKRFELLAPGGDLDSIKAAIAAGADAIYCGLNRFNARNRAENINVEELSGIVKCAHDNDCKIFITLNILILDNEIRPFINLLNRLVNIKIDGVIVQDIGALYLLKHYFKNLKVHASTQFTTHNKGQIKFIKKLNAERVNLCRELSFEEIKPLTNLAHSESMAVEVFVHGSNCISFSGQCYMSSVQNGKSGNRGRCSQPCRDKYKVTSKQKYYPLNLKDNCTISDIKTLYEIGVDSLKIEGRIKKFHYVYVVVKEWRKQLDNFYEDGVINSDYQSLFKIFNRGYINSFLLGKLSNNMFIDNPRDNSAYRLKEIKNRDIDINGAKREVYDNRTKIIEEAREKIDHLSFNKIPLHISFIGRIGNPLNIKFNINNKTYVLTSSNLLVKNNQKLNNLSHEDFNKRFGKIIDTDFYLEDISINELEDNLYLSQKDLNSLKIQFLNILNGGKKICPNVELLPIKYEHESSKNAELYILISSEKDISKYKYENVYIYFQLPNNLNQNFERFIKIFEENDNVIPYFPAILIDKDYEAALKILNTVSPSLIVTNNMGIGYEASQRSIKWIAGPYSNITNSYSALCLKEEFNCVGAFVSNELSFKQMKKISCPNNFKLYYSIYHPIQLMVSRACLFTQIDGCHKEFIDNDCLSCCKKESIIVNMKNDKLLVNKKAGEYCKIYDDKKFLNLEIINDLNSLFSGYLIDLRDIEKTKLDNDNLITLFQRYINGDVSAGQLIKDSDLETKFTQYVKGV